jgi:hypothetical protein
MSEQDGDAAEDQRKKTGGMNPMGDADKGGVTRSVVSGGVFNSYAG